MQNNPQLNANGELRHLLSIEGLPREVLLGILDTAASFVGVTEREVKKVPLLRGKSVFNLFFEPSTRTRTTFEIAAKRLSADVINLNVAASSQTKGESLLDTVSNLSAMQADLFLVRHGPSGAPFMIARHVKPHEHVLTLLGTLEAFGARYQRLRLLIEPGRSVVGNAGILLTRVIYLKPGTTRRFSVAAASMAWSAPVSTTP